jgi:serine/threonine protein kinase
MKLFKNLVKQTVAALKKIHGATLFHGAIKSSNVLQSMLSDFDEFNLSDLGVFS